MRWTAISIAALSISGASCSNNGIFNAGSNMLSKLIMPQRRVVPVNSHQQSRNVHPRQFFDSPGSLFRRQDPGRCGAAGNNRRCENDLCCSEYGWCGDSFDYCAELVGCQPQFGRCGDAPVPTSTPTPTPTPTPSSSSSSSSSSTSSTRISSSSSSTSSSAQPTPTGPLIISTNGQCGNVTTCAGSGFGSCCSEFYFCGSSSDYCGTGCRSGFGNCGAPGGGSSSSSSSSSTSSSRSSSSSSSSTRTSTPTPTPTPTSSSTSSTRAPTPTPTLPVSTNGQCGNGVGCVGSTFGECCSEYGWCGSSPDYCRRLLGCQPQWGNCDAT